MTDGDRPVRLGGNMATAYCVDFMRLAWTLVMADSRDVVATAGMVPISGVVASSVIWITTRRTAIVRLGCRMWLISAASVRYLSATGSSMMIVRGGEGGDDRMLCSYRAG